MDPNRAILLRPKEEPSYSFENLKQKVQAGIEEDTTSLEGLERFLRSWWCGHYNKPYKSPELLDYTLEELLWEFLSIRYRANPQLLQHEKEEKEKAADAEEDESWLKQQMDTGYRTQAQQERELKANPEELEAIKSELAAIHERHVTFGEG